MRTAQPRTTRETLPRREVRLQGRPAHAGRFGIAPAGGRRDELPFKRGGQPVDDTAHQIAEITSAMRAVETAWAELEHARVDYEIACLRLRLLVKAAHEFTAAGGSSTGQI